MRFDAHHLGIAPKRQQKKIKIKVKRDANVYFVCICIFLNKLSIWIFTKKKNAHRKYRAHAKLRSDIL